jgi:hypothetical protein
LLWRYFVDASAALQIGNALSAPERATLTEGEFWALSSAEDSMFQASIRRSRAPNRKADAIAEQLPLYPLCLDYHAALKLLQVSLVRVPRRLLPPLRFSAF